jgi:hypothetical protein
MAMWILLITFQLLKIRRKSFSSHFDNSNTFAQDPNEKTDFILTGRWETATQQTFSSHFDNSNTFAQDSNETTSFLLAGRSETATQQKVTELLNNTSHNKILTPKPTSPPWWCPNQQPPTEPNNSMLLIASCMYVRIYANDLSANSRLDLLHWLAYHRYAGVERVYLYDCWRAHGENLKEWLQPAIDAGYVVYTDWHDISMKMIDNPHGDHITIVEVPARAHCIQNYGHLFTWVLHTDMDEFLFSEKDIEEGFLKRFLQSAYVTERPEIVEHTVQNYLMLDWRNYSQGSSVFQQVLRRTKQPGNNLVKPIVLSSKVLVPSVHHNILKHGTSQDVPPDILAMNHYWGGRLQGWKPEMSEDLQRKTEVYTKMLQFVSVVKACDETNAENV